MAPVIRFELMSTVLETAMLPLHQTGYKSIVGDIILAVTMHLICFAERQGFEPQNLLQLPVFKTGAFNHSAIFPGARGRIAYLHGVHFGFTTHLGRERLVAVQTTYSATLACCCERRNRTFDLQVMSLASYRCYYLAILWSGWESNPCLQKYK